jgi:hypothetical protein
MRYSELFENETFSFPSEYSTLEQRVEYLANLVPEYGPGKNRILEFEIDGGKVNALHVNFIRMDITSIPFEFGKVTYFNVSNNPLTDLKGSPKTATHFHAQQTEIKSLVGCPERVIEDFFVGYNGLRDLSNGPKYVGGIYEVRNGNLNSWKGISNTEIGGIFKTDARLPPIEYQNLIHVKEIEVPWLRFLYWHDKVRNDPRLTIRLMRTLRERQAAWEARGGWKKLSDDFIKLEDDREIEL